jgi:polar amino acid transport system substrate-binding protein
MQVDEKVSFLNAGDYPPKRLCFCHFTQFRGPESALPFDAWVAMLRRMIARRRVLSYFLCLLALPLAGCREKPAGGADLLRVGMDLSYPPFEMQDKAGKPDGVSVRLAEAMAAALGRPLQIVPMNFSGLIPALNTGNIDLILSSMTATDERRKSLDFSNPYAFTGLALLVGRESGFQSIEDLKKSGRTVAVKAGTTGETWASQHLPEIKRVVFEDQTACVMEVAQGRADAFIYAQLSVLKYAKENQASTRALLDPFVEEAWAVGVAKGNEELLQQVNAFLEKFRAEDGFGKLGEQYLRDEKKTLEAAGIPFILR